jgi:hypothetical protein
MCCYTLISLHIVLLQHSTTRKSDFIASGVTLFLNNCKQIAFKSCSIPRVIWDGAQRCDAYLVIVQCAYAYLVIVQSCNAYLVIVQRTNAYLVIVQRGYAYLDIVQRG